MTLLFLGIDGGGTKTRARIEDEAGNLLGVGLSGPSNLVRGIPAAKVAILEATTAALQQAGLPTSNLANLRTCVGVAGANVKSYSALLHAWQHPFHSLRVTTDLHIALVGAHGGQEGAVIITGTGFCGGIVRHGQYQEVGGHGLTLGDGGSGAMLGLRAVRHTLEALDGIVASTDLSLAICNKLGCDTAEELVSLSIDQPPSFFAALSPVVFEWARLEDDVALAIVRKAATFTSNYAKLLLKMQPERFSLIGGVAPFLLPYLPESIKTSCSPAICSPVEGAVLLARQSSQTCLAANL